MSDQAIQVDNISTETLLVPVKGTSPLIVHRFSEKSKREMLNNTQGKKSPKEPKDPAAEYEAAFYRVPDGYGLPSVAFKSATVGGARFYRSITMAALKQFLFIKGQLGSDGRALTRIEGTPEMREDVVTVGRGGSELRYRPQFIHWSALLEITYVTSALTRGTVLSLIDSGGRFVGVGEWRPEKDGEFGTYRIDHDTEIAILGEG